MVHVLQSCTQITTLHKIRAHTNIDENKQAVKLAKRGCKLDHIIAIKPYEHAYSMPHCFQKEWWHFMLESPNKGPIKHLEKHILEYDKNHNLSLLAYQTHQVYGWLGNTNIDKEFSNNSWKKPNHHQQLKHISNKVSRHYILMNAQTYDGVPQENIVPT